MSAMVYVWRSEAICKIVCSLLPAGVVVVVPRNRTRASTRH